jgi:methionine-rich copper-binding protein CopC
VLRRSLLALALALAGFHHAAAHAFLKRAVPAANSIVAPPPAELRLIFGEKLEPGFAKLQVSVNGQALTGLPAAATGDDATTVTLALPAPAPGTYTVKWSVVAHDGHRTSGTYIFTAKTK